MAQCHLPGSPAILFSLVSVHLCCFLGGRPALCFSGLALTTFSRFPFRFLFLPEALSTLFQSDISSSCFLGDVRLGWADTCLLCVHTGSKAQPEQPCLTTASDPVSSPFSLPEAPALLALPSAPRGSPHPLLPACNYNLKMKSSCPQASSP